MAKYRKKPVVIDAWLIPDNPDDAEWLLTDLPELPGNVYVSLDDSGEEGSYGGITIETLEGVMRGDPGDWLIRGVQGEFYPCKPDIFEATYEADGGVA